MNELPELPFEKVLSYLSLEDRLRSKAVSRRWYWMINSFQVKSLFYSERPAGFFKGKHRLISGSLAQNFIYSAQYATFFTASRMATFSNLKHLRLYDLKVDKAKRKTFASVLQSFGQLEQLDIIGFDYDLHAGQRKEFKLNFPMLTGLWIDGAVGFWKLKLDAPKLQKVRVCFARDQGLELVHSESVEWLMVRGWTTRAVEEMKNLKYLYLAGYPKEFESSLLSSLPELREIHLYDNHELSWFFEQKQRHARADLKIFYFGLLLTRPDDPAIDSFNSMFTAGTFSDEAIGCLAENSSWLADEIPFCKELHYSAVEGVAPELQMSLLKKFTHLRRISVWDRVEDIERFLNILKNLDIEHLDFLSRQPQELFNRLPEHCGLRQLTMKDHWGLDICFLFRLKHLMKLSLNFYVNAESIRAIIEANEFLSWFEFKYSWFDFKWIGCRSGSRSAIVIKSPKQFKARTSRSDWTKASNLDGVFAFFSDSRKLEEEEMEPSLTYADPELDDEIDEFLDQFDSVLNVKRLL